MSKDSAADSWNHVYADGEEGRVRDVAIRVSVLGMQAQEGTEPVLKRGVICMTMHMHTEDSSTGPQFRSLSLAVSLQSPGRGEKSIP